LIVLVATGVLLCSGTAVYLRRNPPYSRQRKFYTTIILVVGTFLAMTFQRQHVPVANLAFISVACQMVAVLLSGLRFDTKTVFVAGVAALGFHLLLVLGVLPLGEYTLPSVILATILLALTTICLTYIVSSMLKLHRESVYKERLSRFLAPEVVEEISNRPELLQQATETRTATILFADLKGFTTLSEQYPAREIGRILNVFLEEMTSAIMDNKGMVDKYIGDAIMGVFGVPVAADNHAAQATLAALEMQKRLKKVNQTLSGENKPSLSIGVGIHTGEVIAGAIGSSRRMDYTVIGDTVNVASRIESLTREYPVDILLSSQTRDLAEGAIALEEVATTQVKGRQQKVTLFTPSMK
jgi:adenylate cyclase